MSQSELHLIDEERKLNDSYRAKGMHHVREDKYLACSEPPQDAMRWAIELQEQQAQKNLQKGFTLIELIVVIVILGILAATALPKFADLSSSARYASLQGAMGSINSAMNLVYSVSLIQGTAASGTSSVTIQGTPILTAFGYPTAAGILTAANISTSNYGTKSASSMLWVWPNGISPSQQTPNACALIYTQATSSGPATVTLSPTDGTLCY